MVHFVKSSWAFDISVGGELAITKLPFNKGQGVFKVSRTVPHSSHLISLLCASQLPHASHLFSPLCPLRAATSLSRTIPHSSQ